MSAIGGAGRRRARVVHLACAAVALGVLWSGWLGDHAVTIYRQNVSRFGKTSDWGKASAERLAEMLKTTPEKQ